MTGSQRGGGHDDRTPLDRALDEVLELEPEARARYVDEALAGDPELQDRVRAMLGANEEADALLAAAHREAASLLTDDEESGPPPLPDRIGDYEVLERLGAGGMGTVYLARKIGGALDRHVALKVIGRAGEPDDVRDRFRAEQRILSRLEHPNVARLYEAGVDAQGVPWFVMEYVDGVPIDRYADEHELTIGGRIGLVLQLAEALAYAHRNLVVHRDVKPSNILVTRDGTVKLLDFGVAKLLESDVATGAPGLTRTGAPLLTPEYASPEQVRGEPVTTSSDVYATGVLLYELLTGVRPYEFTSRSPVHIEAVVSGQEPRRPSAAVTGAGARVADARSSVPSRLARSLKGDLDWIVLKALRKEPEARYGTVRQLADDLTRFLEHQPVEARPPTLLYRARKFANRNRGALTATTLVFASLVAGVGVATWQAREATRQAEQADRVKELIVGLFEGSDPEVAQGQELTAVELLSRGEASLLDGLADEPRVRAELLRTLGTIYTSLGEYDRARPLLDSALAIGEASGGDEEMTAALAAVADLRYGLGQYEEGEAIARRRLELQRQIDAERTTALAAALTDVAVFLSSQARYDEAEPLILEALEIDREQGDAEKEGQDLNSLNILRQRMGDYDGAIEAGEQAIAAHRRHAEGDDIELATAMASLAFTLDAKGEFERADSLYAATLAMRRRMLGDDHPHIATVLNNLASMRQKEGRLEESRELHEQALAMRRRIFGDDHADVAASLNNLGIVHYYEADYAGAEEAFRESLRIFRLHRAEDHPHVLTNVNNLAAVLQQQGKLDEAGALFRETLAERLRVLGPDHHDTGGAYNNLGGVLQRQGDPVGAEVAHRQAVEIFRAVLTPDHPDLSNALMSLGRSLVDQGRYVDALAPLEESCPIYTERHGPDHANSAACDGLWGVALHGAGREEEAGPLLTRAVPILESERAGQEWTIRAREALDALGR